MTDRQDGPADVGGLVEDVYAELRRLADGYVRRERANSVQATELVHEAFLRMARGRAPKVNDRRHFVALAAIAMRRLLVERARARTAAKRGGAQVQVTLDESLLPASSTSPDVLAIDQALTRLAALDATQARIVELRYFGGLSVEETAEALDLSAATIKRHWTIAKAWLLRELEGSPR
ncbi:MAG: ECF-type sigma factor [Vicinamibacterales bacterium]